MSSAVDEALLAELTAWLTEGSLAGRRENELLAGFCERLERAGLPLARAIALVDTLHPIYEGRAFRWNRSTRQTEVLAYARTREGPNAEAWRRSPLYYMVQANQSLLRRRLADPVPSGDMPEFPTFAELRAEGMTDFVALLARFSGTGVIGEMDAIYSMWTSDGAAGFAENHIDLLERLFPSLAAALKSASLARIAATLVETYLVAATPDAAS